ncbi:hypothetical protein QFZ34_002114 [Phyllobacterium ifriqiyense]|uniref:Uncharacterized protein n=1 Tax=Phyllobacterium ifriqiyense TaxID=314238 RepID=A0ABU0S859_9HYPH|nr:hypothetical protein [Phyllobacterium ifriqiyense]MDQ0996932.1 hypothetical protein [Phyllobacterium ifriqiyense]
MNHKQIAVGQDNLSAVLNYFKTHLCATNVECAEALGLSVMAVGRHVKTIRASPALFTNLQDPDTDKNWHSDIWPGQTAQTVIKEMITVATGEYEEFEGDFDPWSCDNRADIDRWQAILSTALAHAGRAALKTEAKP